MDLQLLSQCSNPYNCPWDTLAYCWEVKQPSNNNHPLLNIATLSSLHRSNGQYIVAGSDDGSFFIWEKSTTNIVQVLRGDDSIVNCLQPHPTSCLLATSGIDPVVRLWSPRAEVGFTGMKFLLLFFVCVFFALVLHLFECAWIQLYRKSILQDNQEPVFKKDSFGAAQPNIMAAWSFSKYNITQKRRRSKMCLNQVN